MGIRPSDLYHVGYGPQDPIRFWFDRAVMNFGSMVSEDIEKASSKAKNEKSAQSAANQRLMHWLDFDNTMKNQRYAKPTPTK